MNNKNRTFSHTTEKASSIALKCALNILTKWNLTPSQINLIIGTRKTSHRDTQKANDFQPTLDRDQLLKISMILNMHASLRSTFQNDSNIYNFIQMKNLNAPFHGDSPIETILRGDIVAIYHVYQAIQKLPFIGTTNPFTQNTD